MSDATSETMAQDEMRVGKQRVTVGFPLRLSLCVCLSLSLLPGLFVFLSAWGRGTPMSQQKERTAWLHHDVSPELPLFPG